MRGAVRFGMIIVSLRTYLKAMSYMAGGRVECSGAKVFLHPPPGLWHPVLSHRPGRASVLECAVLELSEILGSAQPSQELARRVARTNVTRVIIRRLVPTGIACAGSYRSHNNSAKTEGSSSC